MFLQKQFFNTALFKLVCTYIKDGGGGHISFDVSLGGSLKFCCCLRGVKDIESGTVKKCRPPPKG